MSSECLDGHAFDPHRWRVSQWLLKDEMIGSGSLATLNCLITAKCWFSKYLKEFTSSEISHEPSDSLPRSETDGCLLENEPNGAGVMIGRTPVEEAAGDVQIAGHQARLRL